MKSKKNKKEKRKPREKEIKKHSLLLPIDITKLGTEEDPCFGRLHNPQAEECRRCGDCEICQIVFAQNNHGLRAEIEKGGKFRDVDEKEIYESKPTIDVKQVKSEIRKIIRTQKSIKKDDLVKNIMVKFNLSKPRVEKYLEAMLGKTDKFSIHKNTLKWNIK